MNSLLDDKEREKRVKEDKDFTSSKIGDLSRLIGYGVLAVAFSLLTSTAPFAVEFVRAFSIEIKVVAAFGILSVLFDYFQYLAGYIDSSFVIKKEGFRYSKSSLSYRARKFFYWGKQLLALVAAFLLVASIVRATA